MQRLDCVLQPATAIPRTPSSAGRARLIAGSGLLCRGARGSHEEWVLSRCAEAERCLRRRPGRAVVSV